MPMLRTVTFRLGAAFAAVVFAVTSGVTSMEVHQLAAHGTSPDAAAVAEATPQHARAQDAHAGHHSGHGGPAHATDHDADDHAGHGNLSGYGHSGHSQHGSPDDCGCMGPCASGAPPTLADASFAAVWHGDTDHEQVVSVVERLIPQDPRSHLLPLPNAPPASA
jgi:hypothetical protein